VLSTISKIPVEDERSAYRTLTPNARQVREFLIGNDLVVTNTDKNLGSLYQSVPGSLEKCQDLINDVSNYKHLHPLTRNRFLIGNVLTWNRLRFLCERDLPNGEQSAILCDIGITIPKERHAVPRFYGNPKYTRNPLRCAQLYPATAQYKTRR